MKQPKAGNLYEMNGSPAFFVFRKQCVIVENRRHIGVKDMYKAKGGITYVNWR